MNPSNVPEQQPSPEPSFVLRGHHGVVHSLSFFSEQSQLLAAGDDSGQVKLWSLETRRPKVDLSTGTSPVLAVKAISDSCLVAQSKGGRFTVYEVGEADVVETACMQGNQHTFCKMLPVRNYAEFQLSTPLVAVPQESVSIGIWDLRSNQVETTMKPQIGQQRTQANKTGVCTALAVVDSQKIAASFEDGCIRRFDIRMQACLESQQLHKEPTFALSVMRVQSSKGLKCKTLVASGGADDCLVVSEVPDLPADSASEAETSSCVRFEERCRLEIGKPGQRGMNCLETRPDSKIFAAGCWDGRVRVFGVRKPRPLASLAYHNGGVQSVSFSWDSVWLASAGEDSRIAFWNVYQ